jgi:hypothetical protein
MRIESTRAMATRRAVRLRQLPWSTSKGDARSARYAQESRSFREEWRLCNRWGRSAAAIDKVNPDISSLK